MSNYLDLIIELLKKLTILYLEVQMSYIKLFESIIAQCTQYINLPIYFY